MAEGLYWVDIPPEPVNVTLFRNRVSAHVVKLR